MEEALFFHLLSPRGQEKAERKGRGGGREEEEERGAKKFIIDKGRRTEERRKMAPLLHNQGLRPLRERELAMTEAMVSPGAIRDRRTNPVASSLLFFFGRGGRRRGRRDGALSPPSPFLPEGGKRSVCLCAIFPPPSLHVLARRHKLPIGFFSLSLPLSTSAVAERRYVLRYAQDPPSHWHAKAFALRVGAKADSPLNIVSHHVYCCTTRRPDFLKRGGAKPWNESTREGEGPTI